MNTLTEKQFKKMERNIKVVMALCALFLVYSACTPRMTKDIAHAAIDLALAACVAENPGKEEPELRSICHYADDLAPVVHELIGAQKKGMSKAGASAECGKADAGAK